MIKRLNNSTSLKNLSRGRIKGQIATLLILIIVVALVFVLTVANLGKVSLTSTNMANTVDSASLYLASQLSTRAHQFSQSLVNSCGNPVRCCQRTGILGTLIAIVLAVVMIVLQQYQMLPFITGEILAGAAGTIMSQATAAAVTAGALGGAIGGAIGGGIVSGTFTGAMIGLVQGAMIGAGIGSAFGFGKTIVAQILSWAGGTVGSAPAAGAAWSLSAMGAGFQTLGYSAFTAGLLTSVPVAASIAFSAASSLYMGYVKDQMTSEAMASAAKSLSGLPNRDRTREGVFLQVFSQIVDDPNKIQDSEDLDGDGDALEKIPYFQQWWHNRIERLKEGVPKLTDRTQKFLMNEGRRDLKSFANYLKRQYKRGGGFLSRQEVERSDGALVELTRALENAGSVMSFWSPGVPDAEAVPYHDEVDAVIHKFQEFVDFVDDIRSQSINELAASWDSWAFYFYDPEEDYDYYDQFGVLVNGDANFKGLIGWKNEIEQLRRTLNPCYIQTTEEGQEYIGNPPCKWDSPFSGSTDADLDDEFAGVITTIDNLIQEITEFRETLKEFYDDMQVIADSLDTGEFGGVNPATYIWEDSLGTHRVIAQVGNFRFARIVHTSYGNFLMGEECVELVNYTDQNRCWVRVTRRDPSNASLGFLGKWNPFNRPIEKLSRARYSYDRVALRNITW